MNNLFSGNIRDAKSHLHPNFVVIRHFTTKDSVLFSLMFSNIEKNHFADGKCEPLSKISLYELEVNQDISNSNVRFIQCYFHIKSIEIHFLLTMKIMPYLIKTKTTCH